MNITEIKKFLEENKEQEEVQALIDSFKVEPSLELFQSKIEEDDKFKSFMDSQKDKHYSKALETWKENNLSKIVDEKIKELYPEDDPKDLELQKLKREMEEIKNNATREKMTNLALKKATELNLPTELIDYFVDLDEEKTIENMDKFSKAYTEGIQETVKAKLEGNGDRVPKNENSISETKSDFMDLANEANIRK